MEVMRQIFYTGKYDKSQIVKLKSLELISALHAIQKKLPQ